MIGVHADGRSEKIAVSDPSAAFTPVAIIYLFGDRPDSVVGNCNGHLRGGGGVLLETFHAGRPHGRLQNTEKIRVNEPRPPWS